MSPEHPNESPDPGRREHVSALLGAEPASVPAGLSGRARDLARRLAASEGADDGTIPTGTSLGPWTILGVAGSGGQATVYHAKHAHLGREAAIKVPRRAVAARLLREAKIAAGLSHPRIVSVEDVAPDAATPYMVLEWCPNGSLADLLAHVPGGLPVERVAEIAGSILDALAFAHRRGVVHCDVKPGNILFDKDGRAKLGDLGVGRVTAEEEAASVNSLVRTSGGLAGGTPAYMAPEQERPDRLHGAPLDGRADLFAFGRVLFEMLTGASGRVVRPPSRVKPGLEPWWDEIVFKLLEEDRESRYPSAEAALEAIRAVRRDPAPVVAVTALAPPPPAAAVVEARPRPAAPRHVGPVGVIFGILLALAPFVAMFLFTEGGPYHREFERHASRPLERFLSRLDDTDPFLVGLSLMGVGLVLYFVVAAVRPKSVREADPQPPRDAAQRADPEPERPSLVARILAIIVGLAGVVTAVVAACALAFVLAIGALARGCGGQVHNEPDVTLLTAAVVAAATLALVAVFWGVVGLIRRAFGGRRG